jgi:hypothetical protein
MEQRPDLGYPLLLNTKAGRPALKGRRVSLRDRGTGYDAAILVPAAAGSFGVAAVATQAPLVGAGAAGLVILTLMPWRVLFFLLTFAAIASRFRYNVGTVTLQTAHFILVPFLIRAWLLTREEQRPAFRWPEFALAVFVGVQVVSSYLYALQTRKSLQVLGLLVLGTVTYLTVYSTAITRKRVIFAARVVLLACLVNSSTGLLALVAHKFTGSTFGLSISANGTPVAGLSHEYNIAGSMAGSAAIVFFWMMIEPNPVFSRRMAAIGFWISFVSLVASLTRGAWLTFVIALVAMLLLHRRPIATRNRVGSFGALLIVLGVGVLGIFAYATATSGTAPPNAIVARGDSLVNSSAGSGQARVSEWKLALDDLPKSPIIGLGTNSYGQRHITPKKSATNQKGAFLGNLWIRSLYDGGIVGLLALLAFWGSIMWPKRAIRESRGDLAPVAWAFTFMVVMMAGAYVTTDASLQIWPWIVLGVAAAVRRLAVEQHEEMKGANVPARNSHGPQVALGSWNGGSLQASGVGPAVGRP